MEIDNGLIHRFFLGETSPEEADLLGAWLREDKSHEEEFRKEYKAFIASQMNAVTEKTSKNHGTVVRRIVRAAGIAAALAFGVFAGLQLMKNSRPAMLMVSAEQGRTTELVLEDGTKVILNSGSTIEYPEKFRRGERRVRLEGEALFDVTHDPRHPFVVETYEYDVRVLGTRFDVVADRDEGRFSTALIEGKVAICGQDGEVKAELKPDQMASVKDNKLTVNEVEDASQESSWTGGILSAGGLSFPELAEKMERCYGVDIVLDRDTPPEIHYDYLKLRIADGIANALDVLSRRSDFSWSYDPETDTYHIR